RTFFRCDRTPEADLSRRRHRRRNGMGGDVLCAAAARGLHGGRGDHQLCVRRGGGRLRVREGVGAGSVPRHDLGGRQRRQHARPDPVAAGHRLDARSALVRRVRGRRARLPGRRLRQRVHSHRGVGGPLVSADRIQQRYVVPANRLRPRGDSAARRGNIRRMAKLRPAANSAPEHLPVREQLERILAGPTFQQSDRLKRFLTFIVLEAIEGHGDKLKEYVIGVQVFGKEESFDPRTDPIVRVQARRLRAKLVHHYREDGRADELIIDLPKGGYAPVFKRRETAVLVKRSIGAALISRNTVAVLPFADNTGTRDLDYFCRGVREEIVHRLTRLPALRVLVSDEPRNRGDAGGAAMIISGSDRRSGDQLRLIAQLVDGASGCYLWSESVDARVDDAFGGQERIAESI